MLENLDEEKTASGFGRLGWIFAAGFALVFVGVIVIAVASALGGGNGSTSTGVVIFIGPFPIVFGSGPDAGGLITIGLIIAIISIVSFVVMRRKL
ncbi:MAG: DUF131 domain-containing protein [Candidatus Bathyarchaeota archaeon]|nr:DUF131 domain-containing protein [Candidatus Bathyarchaeota archaeon]